MNVDVDEIGLGASHQTSHILRVAKHISNLHQLRKCQFAIAW